MADISDVRDALASLAMQACYPEGTVATSVTTKQITVGGGWPEPADVDAAMAAGTSIVSVYPIPGATAHVFQILNEPYVIVPPSHGISVASISAPTITFAGNAGTGEYVTVIAEHRRIYSRNGATLADILSAIAADASADYPGASATATTLTFPGIQEVEVRIGAPATMGQVTHRQKQQLRITIFAPTDFDRTAISAAIDVAFKSQLRITLPDTSQAILTFTSTLEDDTSEKFGNFRRGLAYDVEYATLETFTSYEVTSVTTSFDPTGTLQNPGSGTVSVVN